MQLTRMQPSSHRNSSTLIVIRKALPVSVGTGLQRQPRRLVGPIRKGPQGIPLLTSVQRPEEAMQSRKYGGNRNSSQRSFSHASQVPARKVQRSTHAMVQVCLLSRTLAVLWRSLAVSFGV